MKRCPIIIKSSLHHENSSHHHENVPHQHGNTSIIMETPLINKETYPSSWKRPSSTWKQIHHHEISSYNLTTAHIIVILFPIRMKSAPIIMKTDHIIMKTPPLIVKNLLIMKTVLTIMKVDPNSWKQVLSA
jgi:hypothetical protein